MKKEVLLVVLLIASIFIIILSVFPQSLSIISKNNSITGEVISSEQLSDYIIELNDPSVLEALKNLRGEEENSAEEDLIITPSQEQYMDSYRSTLSSKRTQTISSIKNSLGKSDTLSYSSDSSQYAAYSDSSPITTSQLVILYEYEYVMNGFSARLTKEDADKIRSLPGVKSVKKSREVVLHTYDSIPLVNADDVWIKLDSSGNYLTGKGVKIAVIDTGIEYRHPMFGRCSTAQFLAKQCPKVIGGRDYVNDDKDPADDNGHGTHVASIAAGSPVPTSVGRLSGVAPEAQILAYKVFPKSGKDDPAVAEPRIIEALDQAVKDDADVVVMSLGIPCVEYNSNCGPDDTLSQKVDNLVEKGIVVITSAGNSGPTSGTITTPGTARKAITVSSTTKTDVISEGSSRGVVKFGSKVILKPDVSAPGEAITAAYILKDNSIFWSLTGTSQAAPHVAGVAALLKQKKPTWSPSKIKSVILSTSNELPMPIKDRGYGRVDALAAINFKGSIPTATIKTNKMLTSKNSGRSFNIEGTAKGKTFTQYELYYTKGDLVPSWVRLRTSRKQIDNGILYENFNADLLPGGSKLREGNNYLKLIVKNTDGSQIESISVINVCRKCT